ncbi:hypothetical protein Bpfe_022607 [Biomphalaria pfeifferi]|uniref:C-type lectin domain-containing protein n=1 Tax=Biomphalaria pfeifferi TaxID=112525 RepID=A0AAD8F1N1_BIOPF|nr:hypothetical protein Bpfe_022607 [Biomphalaria pfeifferi]
MNQFRGITFLLAFVFLQMFTKPTASFQCRNSQQILTVEYHNGNCYIVGRTVLQFSRAYEYCKIYNGLLTDVDEGFTNFINTSSFTKQNEQYWIGIIWAESLHNWTWVNGAYHRLNVVRENIVDYGYCAKYSPQKHETYLEARCTKQLSPICKVVMNNGTNSCQQLCNEDKEMPDFLMATTEEPNGTESSSNETNTTMTSEKLCKTFDSNIENLGGNLNMMVLLIVVFFFFVSLLINLVLIFRIIHKFRKSKILRNRRKTAKISMIDILNVGGEDVSPGENYESMVYQNDNLKDKAQDQWRITKDGNVKDYDVVNNKLTLNYNYSEVYVKGAISPTDQNATYSALEHSGLPLEINDSSHLYGIDSGSVHSLQPCATKSLAQENPNNETANIYSDMESSES